MRGEGWGDLEKTELFVSSGLSFDPFPPARSRCCHSDGATVIRKNRRYARLRVTPITSVSLINAAVQILYANFTAGQTSERFEILPDWIQCCPISDQSVVYLSRGTCSISFWGKKIKNADR